MSETKTLKELIELARAGKKFVAFSPKTRIRYYPKDFLGDFVWSSSSIISEWEYEEIREPQVLEFEFDCRKNDPDKAMNRDVPFSTYKNLCEKKWKIVATEILSEEE